MHGILCNIYVVQKIGEGANIIIVILNAITTNATASKWIANLWKMCDLLRKRYNNNKTKIY